MRLVTTRGRVAAIGLGLALTLTAAACSSDSDEDATTSSTTETTPTTVPIVTAEVTADFDGPVSPTEAEQAATTMERRLTKYFELKGESSEGSEVVVDEAGTGLEITVPGTDDTEEAAAIVTALSFRGDLYFRPGLVQYPPEPGQPLAPVDATPDAPAESDPTASTTTSGVETTTTTAPTTTTSTAPPATIPTPVAPDDDDPTGTSVLEWRDIESPEQLSDPSSAKVLGIWEIGPSALSGSAVEDSQLTTLSGDPAVKVVLADDADGLDAFNSLAESCFSRTTTCPSGAYTVTFDGTIVVASIPRPNNSTFRPFSQNDLIIYSSEWTEDVALSLAVAFEAGALPVPISVTSG